ncbi:MAG: hypothetical protein ABH876_01640 [Patescibacteria group bacterium]|nr:hypothetical protein [Patescibacteria group bacterium]MBU1877076.1 hypothetical protein [Patescibacteria group bacterium]
MISINKKCLAIVLVILAILIIAVAAINLDKIKSMLATEKKMPIQEAANLAVDYINNNLLAEGASASLMNVAEESGLYRIHIKISDQEYDSYISQDGLILFPQNWVKLESQKEELPNEESPVVEDASLEILAKCLTEKGFKFYGSSSCSWCNKEKDLFGNAAQYLPYIECVGSDGQLAQACIDAKIESFPTWESPDGTKSPGFRTLEELSQSSGCSL